MLRLSGKRPAFVQAFLLFVGHPRFPRECSRPDPRVQRRIAPATEKFAGYSAKAPLRDGEALIPTRQNNGSTGKPKYVNGRWWQHRRGNPLGKALVSKRADEIGTSRRECGTKSPSE